MLRSLYDYLLRLSSHRRASWVLSFFSFLESSIFPIPPDVMLIPMVLARPERWWRLAAICTISSVAGAFLGYALGAFAFVWLASPILDFYGATESFSRLTDWYSDYGSLAIFFAAVTPFPYKVLTIFSGFVEFPLWTFFVVSLFGRSLRFFLVSYLLYLFGDWIRAFIQKYLGLLFVAFFVLLIGGYIIFDLLS